MTGSATGRGSAGIRTPSPSRLQIVSRRSDSAHRVAFGSLQAAQGFIAAAADPVDWTVDDQPAADTTPSTN
jgi:hypothetical protein